MPKAAFLGEWEHLVLLAVLHLRDHAYALPLRNELNRRIGRSVSRGALYRTLDRLASKGYVAWKLHDDDGPLRGGHPRRCFRVTSQGMHALRASRRALTDLWRELEDVL